MLNSNGYPQANTINPTLVMEEVCSRVGPDWTFDTLKTVLITSAAGNVYIPAINPPKTIDMGALNQHMRYLDSEGERRGGIEIGRSFLIDFAQQTPTLIFGKTIFGETNQTFLNITPQHNKQIPVAFMHNHPRELLTETGNGPFSITDYKTFMKVPSAMLSILVMGDRYLVVAKTSVTERRPGKHVYDLIDTVGSEYTYPDLSWTIGNAIRANKELCAITGLCMYYGMIGNTAEKVRVV